MGESTMYTVSFFRPDRGIQQWLFYSRSRAATSAAIIKQRWRTVVLVSIYGADDEDDEPDGIVEHGEVCAVAG